MRHDTQNIRRRRGRRKEDVFRVIVEMADENTITPSVTQIAEVMNISVQRVSLLMRELEIEGRITWLDRYRYRVNPSDWEYTGS